MPSARTDGAIRLTLGVVAASCGWGACSSPPEHVYNVRHDFAGLYCRRLAECHRFQLRSVYGDVATCRDRLELLGLSVELDEAAVAEPFRAQAALCGVDFARRDCALWRAVDPVELSACIALPKGVALGGSCRSDSQCASGFCYVKAGQTCGGCSMPFGEAGACTQSEECHSGSVCVGGVCRRVSALDEPCEPSDAASCTVPLVCHPERSVCVEPAREGMSCAILPCDTTAELVCAGEGTCQKCVWASPAEPCNVTEGKLCLQSGTCSGGYGDGTCVSHAQDGALCDPVTGPTCLYPAECLGGVCVVSKPPTCQ